MPGHVLENVAFVDLHGVGDLSADRLDSRRVQRLDDLFRASDMGSSDCLAYENVRVVIRAIPFAPESV